MNFASSGIEKSSSKIESAFAKVEKFGKGVQERLEGAALALGKAAIPFAGISAGIGVAIHEAVAFDKTMQTLAATSGLTTEELQKMQLEARRAGATTSFSAEQAAQSFMIMAKEGFNAAEQQKLLALALDTAEATGAEATETTLALSRGLSTLDAAFDPNLSKADRFSKLSEMFAVAVNKGGASVGGLSEALQFGGATLSKFGIPAEQIVASLTKLERAGIGGAAGAQQLNMMLQQLAEPSDLARSELAKLGIDASKLDLKDVAGTVSTLSRSFSAITDPVKRARLENEVFGARGMKIFSALERGGSDSLQTLSKDLANASGQVEHFAEIRTNTFEEQLHNLKNAFSAITLEIGSIFTQNKETVIPFLKLMVENVRAVAQAFLFAAGDVNAFGKPFDELSPKQKALIEFAQGFREGILEAFNTAKNVVMSLVGAFETAANATGLNTKQLGFLVSKFVAFAVVVTPIMAGIASAFFFIGNMVAGVSAIIGIFGSVLGTIGAIAAGAFAEIGLFVSFLLTPIGLATAAVAVLSAGILGIISRWDEVKASFETGFIPGMFALFKAFGQGILDLILLPITAVKSAVKGVLSFAGLLPNVETVAIKNQESNVEAVVDAATDANRVQQQVVNQSRLTAPASSEDFAAFAQPSASTTSGGSNSSGASQSQAVTVPVSVQIDGREIARAVARQNIENSERQGEKVAPGDKRRLLESGAMAGGQ